MEFTLKKKSMKFIKTKILKRFILMQRQIAHFLVIKFSFPKFIFHLHYMFSGDGMVPVMVTWQRTRWHGNCCSIPGKRKRLSFFLNVHNACQVYPFSYSVSTKVEGPPPSLKQPGPLPYHTPPFSALLICLYIDISKSRTVGYISQILHSCNL
jgi:hypothetical protein